jgi:glycerophosphoryl diester phosphodiesterase
MKPTGSKPLIIAHRGASALAPENTLASFKQAIEDGAEGIEFDIQLSKDLVPMVFHDEDLKRIAESDKLVTELDSNELRKIDVGSWFNKLYPEKALESFTNERISTLSETLKYLKDFKGLIYIELKGERVTDIEGFSKAVCDVIKNSSLLPQIIVKSFNLDILPLIKKYCPDVRTAALFSPTVMILLRKEKRLISIATELETDGLSLHFSLATKKLMRKAKRRDLKVAIWTADNPRWVKRGVKLEIDHIITNNPALLLAKRQEFS